jgi:hypothetical protein
MPSKLFLSALAQDLPVLFAYIGWASEYDGTNAVIGGHGWLKGNPRENGEARAFVRQDGFFFGGIGRGNIAYPHLHVVFVAVDPETQIKRVVGIYAGATVETQDNMWTVAKTRHAIGISIDRRPKLAAWVPGQGMRRWASRERGQSHPGLLTVFHRLKADIQALAKRRPREITVDQTYSGLEVREGEQQHRLILHRRREARLRKMKINAARFANDDRLICEVPGCGFDFFERYGEIGSGYAQVHHLRPLAKADKHGQKTRLKDLAVVCANCHSMIHNGGECRSIKTLIPPKSRQRK